MRSTSSGLRIANLDTPNAATENENLESQVPNYNRLTCAKMEEKIRRVLENGSRTEREIKQRTNYKRAGIWFFNTAFNNLKTNGEIRKKRSNKVFKWELTKN